MEYIEDGEKYLEELKLMYNAIIQVEDKIITSHGLHEYKRLKRDLKVLIELNEESERKCWISNDQEGFICIEQK